METTEQWNARLAENRRKLIEAQPERRIELTREQTLYGITGLLVGGFGKGRAGV